MVRVTVSYRLPDPSSRSIDDKIKAVQETGDLCARISSGLQFLRKEYNDVLGGLALPSEQDASYIIDFKNNNEIRLERALNEFVRISGTPDFVEKGYDIAERVLSAYGKRLKRKFSGLLTGKHVVNVT